MTAEALDHARTALQTVSTLALVGSVVYAAVQLRNWHKSQQVSNFIKLVEMQMQLRRMRVERPELAEVHKHDTDGLATPRDVQFFFLNLMQLSVFEIAWYSHRMGQLNDDYFRSWERRMRVIKCEESFQRMWDKRSMKILHDDFETYMRSLMAEPGDCDKANKS
jgi:hypothetical protein